MAARAGRSDREGDRHKPGKRVVVVVVVVVLVVDVVVVLVDVVVVVVGGGGLVVVVGGGGLVVVVVGGGVGLVVVVVLFGAFVPVAGLVVVVAALGLVVEVVLGVNEAVNGSDNGDDPAEGAVVVVVEPGTAVVVVDDGDVNADGCGAVVVVDESPTRSADCEDPPLPPRKLRYTGDRPTTIITTATIVHRGCSMMATRHVVTVWLTTLCHHFRIRPGGVGTLPR